MDDKPSHGSDVVASGNKDLVNESPLSTGADSAVGHEPSPQQPEVILTPDQRVRVFISSTLEAPWPPETEVLKFRVGLHTDEGSSVMANAPIGR